LATYRFECFDVPEADRGGNQGRGRRLEEVYLLREPGAEISGFDVYCILSESYSAGVLSMEDVVWA